VEWRGVFTKKSSHASLVEATGEGGGPACQPQGHNTGGQKGSKDGMRGGIFGRRGRGENEVKKIERGRRIEIGEQSGRKGKVSPRGQYQYADKGDGKTPPPGRSG